MPKTAYSTEAFWEEKYKTTCCQHYEWLTKLSTPFIDEIISKIDPNQSSKILQIGSGTSLLNERILTQFKHKNGEQSVSNVQMVCIDFSKEVIKKRKGKDSKGFKIRYLCVDVRQMKPFSGEQYDLIVDKGTIDCLLCQDNFMKEVLKALMECYRVLKKGGKMLIISHGKPKLRNYLFRNKLVPFLLEYEIVENEKERVVYMYKLTKGEETIIKEEEQEEQGSEEGERQENEEMQAQMKEEMQAQMKEDKKEEGENEEQQKDEEG